MPWSQGVKFKSKSDIKKTENNRKRKVNETKTKQKKQIDIGVEINDRKQNKSRENQLNQMVNF